MDNKEVVIELNQLNKYIENLSKKHDDEINELKSNQLYYEIIE